MTLYFYATIYNKNNIVNILLYESYNITHTIMMMMMMMIIIILLLLYDICY